jgi:hypothetical protein
MASLIGLLGVGVAVYLARVGERSEEAVLAAATARDMAPPSSAAAPPAAVAIRTVAAPASDAIPPPAPQASANPVPPLPQSEGSAPAAEGPSATRSAAAAVEPPASAAAFPVAASVLPWWRTAERAGTAQAPRAWDVEPTGPDARSAEGADAPQGAVEAPRRAVGVPQPEPNPLAREHVDETTTPPAPPPASPIEAAATPLGSGARREEEAPAFADPASELTPASGPTSVLASAAAARPASSPDGARATRVFVHHRAGSAAALGAAQDAAAAALRAGLLVTELRAVSATPAAPEVRFFHAADAEAAERLARGLGPAWRVRDFRRYVPPPRAGTLEVWVPSG